MLSITSYISLIIVIVCVGCKLNVVFGYLPGRLSLLKGRLSRLCMGFHLPDDVERCAFGGPGTVLVSKAGEYDPKICKTAILVMEHDDKGTQGLIMNKPHAFPLGDVAPGIGVFASNTLYLGGSDGSDTAVMIHKFDLGGSAKHLGNGIFVGGMREARELVESFKATPKDFRFVFNGIKMSAGVLDADIKRGRWLACRVEPERLVKEPDLWHYVYSRAEQPFDVLYPE